MSAPPGAAPWERQPIDTDESWPAFRNFRDARPPRKIGNVYDASGVRVPIAKARDWYLRFGWRERSQAYDAHLDEVLREEREETLKQDIRAVAARQRQLMNDAHELVDRELQKLLQASRENEMAGLLKPAELTKLLEQAIKLDRLVREQSTENHDHSFDTSKLPLDELRKLNDLLDKGNTK